MNKAVQLVLVILAVFVVSGSQIEASGNVTWYSIEEAQQLNKQEPRKFLIDVYTDWCMWCTRMDQTTFSHPEIAEYINDNFYAVKFDAESTKPVDFNGRTFVNKGEGTRSNHQFAIALLQGKMSYPSIAYLNEELQLLGAISGFKKPADMEPIIKFIAEEVYKEQSLQDYIQQFEGSIQ